MRILYRAAFFLLILTLPLTVIFGAENLLCRAPDFYSYEFTKSEAISEMGSGVTADSMSQMFSDFLLGKQEQFGYKITYRDQETELFTLNDRVAMINLKSLLDKCLYIFVGAAVLSAAAYVLLLRRQAREKIRRAYQASAVVFALFWAGLGCGLYFLPDFVRDSILKVPFEEESVLEQLFTEVFVRDWFIAGFAVSAIMMVVLGLAIWRTTKPRRMFW